jgi:hypothetical protein
VAPAVKLRVGVVNSTGWGVDSIFEAAGINVERLDVGDGSDISVITTALSHGMKPLVLYNPGPNGGLGGVSPATAASQVKALAEKLLPLGLTEIEFGNEVYYQENAATYAAQYDAAHQAVAGMGVKLLAVGTALSSGCGGYSTPTWISDFIHALPGGAGEVDAWTIHPFGPMSGYACVNNQNGFGWQTVKDWHDLAVAAGSTAPWYVTEVGQCVGGARCNQPVSEAAQGADMTQYLNDVVTKYPWVVFITFYTSRDDSTGQYGLLNSDNSRRPAFTALQNWVAANAASIDG